jgi:UDP-N-acetylmuramoylalanine--D-glutamate ligase
VVTNIAPNHLDRHKTMECYTEAKRAIVEYQSEGDFAILNADDTVVREFASAAPARKLFFSRSHEVAEGAFVRNTDMVLRYCGEEQTICSVHDLAIKGAHNVENALAAICAVRCALGDSWCRASVVEALSEFHGLEHRLEFVREFKGVKYYNDSIATNPASVIVALRAFSAPKVMIAGGYDKKLPFDEMAEVMLQENVKAAVLLGDTKLAIRDAVLKAASGRPGLDLHLVDTFEQAVVKSSELATWGDIVLMSPGCASYGMFVNFEERGKLFKELVGRLS